MLIDDVVWMWLKMTVDDQMVAQEGLGINVGRYLGFFYSDNSMIGARDSE